MLSFLKIKNLALVEDVTWELGKGLIGVTGETGAGKSIIVGALKLILGERADRGLIRTGQDQCSAEAAFHLDDPASVNAVLAEAGVDPCDGGELIVKRVVSTAGTNKQLINGSPVTIAVLKSVGEYLVDLHGPHDHQSLNSRDRQMQMLDKYAGSEGALESYREAWKKWRAVVNELEELTTGERASQQQIDMLKHQIKEISAAKLKPGEDDEIEAKHRLVANSARLAELGNGIADRLGEGKDCVLNALRDIGKSIHDLEKIDPASARMFEEFESAQITLREMEGSVRDYLGELELDPKEFANIEARMSLLQSLKRKYAPTINEVIAHLADCEAKLLKTEGRTEEVERLTKLVKDQRVAVDKQGKALTKKRSDAAPKLAKDIGAHF
jgi:DNA repair protein RecN (Recombination protein N)